MLCGAEKLDARNVDQGRSDGLGVAHHKQLVARWLGNRIAGESRTAIVTVDGLDCGGIVVVVVERPVACLVINEVDPLGHVGIDDGSLVAGSRRS